MKKIPQDVVGNIAILKFKKSTPWIVKKFRARSFLKKTPNVTTVVEKVEGFSGRLRKSKTKHLAGIKTKEAVYRENGLIFRFNIDETYFSPRLSTERKITAEEISRVCKKNSKILVMFGGVAPFPIVLAKVLKKKNVKIFSNEINKKANVYAKKNIYNNKFSNIITLIPGDAKRIPSKEKFDIILMTRPNLKETFLITALNLSKKGTVIFYHGFGTKDSVLDEIKSVCKNKIGKISLRKAGDIGREKFRWLANFKVN